MLSLIQGKSPEEMRRLFLPVDAVITDPPYGKDFQSNARKEKIAKIANDDAPFIWWLRDAYELLPEGGRLVCFCSWDTSYAFKCAIEWAGFNIKNQCIWNKNAYSMGDLKGQMAIDYEVFWYATKGRYEFKNGRPKSIFTSQRVITQGQEKHPNEKPVDLMEQIIEAITVPGETILDPFFGSGATLKAALNKGRSAVGIECDPVYFERVKRELNGV
jgi:site-specific DNA-methyltransferase (adenine-specific)